MWPLLGLLSPWTIVAGLLAYIGYQALMAQARFFERMGVDHVRPVPLLGSLWRPVLRGSPFTDALLEHYAKFKHRSFYGFFDFDIPLLMVRDPQLIAQITVRDFDHFVDHREYLRQPELDPLLGKSLFLLRGDNWRDMRATLAPAFTGSRIRQMFHHVVACSHRYTGALLAEEAAAASAGGAESGARVVEMADVARRFAIDVIGSTAFGIEVDSWRDRQNAFYRMAMESMLFHNRWTITKVALLTAFPRLGRWLGVRLHRDEHNEYYRRMVHETMRQRERDSVPRPDMIQLLMEARNGSLQEGELDLGRGEGGYAEPEEGSDDLRGVKKRFWSEADVTAQCYMFVFAGSETLSTLLCFAAQELMENRHVQEKLFAELEEADRRLAGQPLTYDVLYRLRYLDMVVTETLRKWPPTVHIDRQCTKDYQMTDPTTGHTITVRRGDCVFMPAFAIHRDPQFYPLPEVFDPERFSDERKHQIRPFTYLALGVGPRNCIGSRYVLMEAKAFLYALVLRFSLEPGNGSEIPIRLTGGGWFFKARNGFKIQLRPRRRAR